MIWTIVRSMRVFATFVLIICLVPSAQAQPAEATEAAAVAPLEAAKALLKEGDFDGAAEAFRSVLRANPQDATARSYLAECHVALGDEERGVAVAQGGDPDFLIFGAPPPPGPSPGPPVAPVQESAPAPPAEAAPLAVKQREEPVEPKEKPKKDRNPRSKARGAAGLALFAPIGGGGVWVEARPHWVFAVTGSVGAAVWPQNGAPLGVLGLAGEATFTPAPCRVGPEVGVGFLALVGPGAWAITDGRVEAPLSGPNRRATPYGRLAFRIDQPRWALSIGAVVVRGAGGAPALAPSFRLGGTFQ